MQSWTLKYTPKTEADLIGQAAPFQELKKFLITLKAKKVALCYGPPGAGKTSAVYVLAKQSNFEVVEINASDFRSAAKIDEVLKPAMQQRSLFTKGKIILVDEMDGLSGTQDRGGLAAILKLLETTPFPVIMTANNPWDKKFSAVRKISKLIPFEEMDHKAITLILTRIAQAEGVQAEETALKTLARRCGGDIRAAINDLQTLSSANKRLTSIELEQLSDRHRTESINQALMKIFKLSDPAIALHALDDIDEDLDRAMLWIDENLPREYTDPNALARAYYWLSKADVYRGRIRRWQHWRFLVYVNALLTAGIATAKDERSKGMHEYKEPTRLLKIWQANMANMKRDAIAEKLADDMHISKKRAIQDVLPYVQLIVKHSDFASGLQAEFDLDEQEMEWLGK